MVSTGIVFRGPGIRSEQSVLVQPISGQHINVQRGSWSGSGQPSTDPDVLAIDEDLLPGGRCQALAVKEQLEDLDGLSERAARGADLRGGAGGRCESDTRLEEPAGPDGGQEAGDLPLYPPPTLTHPPRIQRSPPGRCQTELAPPRLSIPAWVTASHGPADERRARLVPVSLGSSAITGRAAGRLGPAGSASTAVG